LNITHGITVTWRYCWCCCRQQPAICLPKRTVDDLQKIESKNSPETWIRRYQSLIAIDFSILGSICFIVGTVNRLDNNFSILDCSLKSLFLRSKSLGITVVTDRWLNNRDNRNELGLSRLDWCKLVCFAAVVRFQISSGRYLIPKRMLFEANVRYGRIARGNREENFAKVKWKWVKVVASYCLV